jgi:diacylglycerol kinase family enzyme
MKIAIIINSKRLTPELEKTLKSDELSLKHNISYDLFLTEPQDIESVINKIKNQSYNAYVIGGGDGTVRSAIQALGETDTAIAIFPIGTFNLLAKTLKYTDDIDALFTVIKNGKTKKIDLIEVNNKIVINHAWIGFYYYILRLREKHQAIIGKNKLAKIIFNTLSLFKFLPIYNLKLIVNNQELYYRTCLIYIGNNEYCTSLFEVGERKTLSSGLLHVTILNCRTRWQLFKCMMSMLLHNKTSSYVTEFSTDELTVTSMGSAINIVLDGELFKLETPLVFVNHHKSLTVFTP